jgi:hypothetical protein
MPVARERLATAILLESQMQKFPEADIGTHNDVNGECGEQHKNKLLE